MDQEADEGTTAALEGEGGTGGDVAYCTDGENEGEEKAAGSRSRGWILTRDASVVRVLETFFVSWMDSDEVWRRTRAECTSYP